jgi:membrane protein
MTDEQRKAVALRAKRAWRWGRSFWAEVGSTRVFDWAAALTYYGMLSIGPALVVVVAMLGLVGGASALVDQMTNFAPGPARDTVTGIITQIKEADTGSGITFLVVGIFGSIWSASGYVGAYGRASIAIRGQRSSESGFAQDVRQLFVTVLMFCMVFGIALMLVLSGPVARSMAKLVGLGDDVTDVWELAKWPVILLAMAAVVSLLDTAAGSARKMRLRLVSFGGLTAIAIWVPLSFAFSFYVQRSTSYTRIYGSLAGVVIFLVWMWLSNVALLLGAVVEARRARRRATVVR